MNRDTLTRLLISLLTALAASVASAETKIVKSPTRLVTLTVEAPEASDVDWEIRKPAGLEYHAVLTAEGQSQCVFYLPEPTTEVHAVSDVINWGARKREKDHWRVTWEAAPPAPVPPQPTPTPTPTPPQPVPDPPPFAAPGLTVLIITEATEVATLPPAQRSIFSSSTVIKWLRDHCVTLSDGDPAVRIWDDDYSDAQLQYTPDVLKRAYRDVLSQANGELPWIGISDGQRGYSGPLPGTIDETLSLLERFGD